MRIVSGKHKGKRIIAPQKLPVRPTTDFAKEALFNILNNRYTFFHLEVLDLFSGTGNMAYEFGSRGAQRITAVDAHVGCVKFIDKTANELDLPIFTVKSDVYKFLNRSGIMADIVFADPPYDFSKENLQKLTEIAFKKNVIREDGVFVLEHSKQIDLSGLDHFQEARKYGSSVFSFFQ